MKNLFLILSTIAMCNAETLIVRHYLSDTDSNECSIDLKIQIDSLKNNNLISVTYKQFYDIAKIQYPKEGFDYYPDNDVPLFVNSNDQWITIDHVNKNIIVRSNIKVGCRNKKCNSEVLLEDWTHMVSMYLNNQCK
jgi:hypothetical protein